MPRRRYVATFPDGTRHASTAPLGRYAWKIRGAPSSWPKARRSGTANTLLAIDHVRERIFATEHPALQMLVAEYLPQGDQS